jgi:hypothetical protein
MADEIKQNVSWSSALEDYFASTGEKAHCLSYLHKRSEMLYSSRRTWIDLPVIVVSSVVGFMSVGSTSMFENDEKMASIGLGIGSLLVSVLQTVNTYFGWAKRAEGHRIASIQYARMYRYLNIEMSLPRAERSTPHELLKYTKEQYDRLAEVSPLLPQLALDEFKRKFAKETEISKPEEANGLEKIVIYNPMNHSKTLQELEQQQNASIIRGSESVSTG